MFSKKATKIDEIFTIDLTLCSKCQIYGEDFVNFRGLLRRHELYTKKPILNSDYIQTGLQTYLTINNLGFISSYCVVSTTPNSKPNPTLHSG